MKRNRIMNLVPIFLITIISEVENEGKKRRETIYLIKDLKKMKLILKICTQQTPVRLLISILLIDKLDLINNLNSVKLLSISEAFEKFPNEAVDVD